MARTRAAEERGDGIDSCNECAMRAEGLGGRARRAERDLFFEQEVRLGGVCKADGSGSGQEPPRVHENNESMPVLEPYGRTRRQGV